MSGTCGGFAVASERLSALAVLPIPRLASLADKEDGDDERGEGVGPPQTEHRVEGEPGEGRDRQVPAGVRLAAVGDECPAGEGFARLPLRPRPPKPGPRPTCGD